VVLKQGTISRWNEVGGFAGVEVVKTLLEYCQVECLLLPPPLPTCRKFPVVGVSTEAASVNA